MNHLEGVRFLFQIAALLFTALLFGQIARWFKCPAVLGELVGGILLGPTLLGHVQPGIHEWLFPIDGPLAIGRAAVAKLGLLSFLFAAGLELDLSQVRKNQRTVAVTSFLGILVPFAVGYAAVRLFPGFWAHSTAGSAVLPLFVGTALSISALPVIARILMDLRLTMTRMASIVLASAVMDDVAGWLLFAVVLSVAAHGGADWHGVAKTAAAVLGLSGAILFAGRAIFRRVNPWIRARVSEPGRFLCLAAGLFFLSAASFETLGIHGAFGAFLTGLVLSSAKSEQDSSHEIAYQMALGVLAPFYFVSIGLTLDYAVFFDLRLCLIVLTIACLGKLLGAGVGAFIGGLPSKEAWAIGFALNARGAMEIVLASVALEAGIIEQRLFVALIFMAVFTSLISGPAIRRLLEKTD